MYVCLYLCASVCECLCVCEREGEIKHYVSYTTRKWDHYVLCMQILLTQDDRQLESKLIKQTTRGDENLSVLCLAAIGGMPRFTTVTLL